MLLYGASLIYGFTGTVEFAGIAKAALSGPVLGLIFGIVFLFVGFCFKISAVPFHMWTPDVYEGAPTPVTAFLPPRRRSPASPFRARDPVALPGHHPRVAADRGLCFDRVHAARRFAAIGQRTSSG